MAKQQKAATVDVETEATVAESEDTTVSEETDSPKKAKAKATKTTKTSKSSKTAKTKTKDAEEDVSDDTAAASGEDGSESSGRPARPKIPNPNAHARNLLDDAAKEFAKGETIISLDTETTGLDHKNEKIVEIAAVKMVDGEIVEEFNSLVNPEARIRPSSFKIHGISEEMVADAPTIAEILPKFLEFVGDHPFVAHNAIFDYSFINEAMKAHLGKRFTNHRIDTFEMYRSVFPEEPSHSLHSLLERLGIPQVIQHRALDDAKALASVYYKLRVLWEQKHEWQLTQLKNIHYLVERYLRIQKTTQILQSEMADLKEIFKLYFSEGGKPLEASTGEVLVSSYRRSYEYDENRVKELVAEAGLMDRAYKLNIRSLDKILDSGRVLNEEQYEAFLEARLSMNESRVINFIKPQPPAPERDDN